MCGKTDVPRYPARLMLNARPLPWVKTATHLGHELSQKCDMEHAAWVTRAKFIEKSTGIRDMFHFARPEQILYSINLYCGDFYGSNLWSLYGQRAEQVYRAHNTAVKLSWDMPRETHTWAVTHLLRGAQPSARERILSGYVGFLSRLQKSASWEVCIMAEIELHDASSVTGLNIAGIKAEFATDPRLISPHQMSVLYKNNLAPMHPEEEWKLFLLEEMLEERQQRLEEGEEGEEIELLTSYCELLCKI